MTPSTFGQHCLQAFMHAVPARCAVFYRIDATLEARDFLLEGMHAPMHAAYLEHYRHLDPLRPSHCSAGGGAVVPLREGMARQDEADNRLYQGFLRRHAVVDVVEVIARVDGRPSAGVSLLRDAAQGRFEAAELARLEPLHALMQMAAASLPGVPVDSLSLLTARERQIALLLRDGASNKLLARQLDIGLPTVKTHLLNLFRKVGARNRTELVALLFL